MENGVRHVGHACTLESSLLALTAPRRQLSQKTWPRVTFQSSLIDSRGQRTYHKVLIPDPSAPQGKYCTKTFGEDGGRLLCGGKRIAEDVGDVRKKGYFL